MNKILKKIMEYRIIYRLMPKWYKFLYSFEIMFKNKSGSLHLGNGYSLNFDTLSIENENEEPAKWIENPDGFDICYSNNYYCSKCNNEEKFCAEFCSNCGKRMKYNPNFKYKNMF